jgi:hypothetical protein
MEHTEDLGNYTPVSIFQMPNLKEEKRTAQCIRQNDSNLCRVDCMSEPSGKQGNPEDEDVSKEIKPDCQPALDGDGHVVRAILHVQTFFGIFDCSVL